MELDLSSQAEDCYMKKHLFNLKSHRSDGLILEVHHSYIDSVGENKRFKFVHISFNDSGSNLAIADHKGNIFILDLDDEKYWQLPTIGISTLISFPLLKKYELLVGLDTTAVVLLHTETGNIIGVLNGHSVPAVEVSYSDDGSHYITSCTAEAIVWDSTSFAQIHRLSLKADVFLKKVIFMPVTNHILACFQDDNMHVWKFGTFECIKQIVPESWKTHHLKAIAITKNGRAMVVGGRTSNLVVFCLDTWVVKKVVELPDMIPGIKQMIFVSESFDGGANKVLAILTTSLEIYFFNIETSVFLKGLHQIFGMAAKMTINGNGKFLASILTSGEVNIYTIEKILSSRKQILGLEERNEGLCKSSSNYLTSRNQSATSRAQKSCESLSTINKQLKEILDVKKLLPILKQFGEYPGSYRILIWKMILQVPVSQECFVGLSSKKCHQSYVNLESKYPLVNKSLCNSLKKLLSNLSYWCPLFAEVDFLPEFAFPFVKLFHSDPLGCFEVVATVIVNWCQNWFEFYPFPPINMLTSLESILGYHEPELLEFFLKNNITSSISVCPLFHTCFSEVLSKNEWLKLWDHILSNEPSFLFMAIVAYSAVCRNAIKSLKDPEEVEKFFHQQKPIDMKMFILKTYQYVKNTPDDIHCRQFFAPFKPLGNGGSYTSFVAYPKLIMDPTAEKLQSFRKEEEELLDEQMKALSIKKELEKKLQANNDSEDQEKIYRDLEEKIRKTVEEEEDRILAQRQKLQNLRQELRMKELEVLETTRDAALKEKIKRKEMEFERLLNEISRRKAREKAEVDVIEEEIRKYYSELLLKKNQLELELQKKDVEDKPQTILEEQSQNFKKDLEQLQKEWSSSQHVKRIDISNKIAAAKGLIYDLEIEMAKEMAKKHLKKDTKKNHKFVEELKKKVLNLENEVERLILENLNNLKKKSENKVVTLYPKDECSCFRECEGTESGLGRKSTSPTHEWTNLKNKMNAKVKGKCTFQRTIKTYSKTKSPGIQTNVRKITTIRSKKHNPKTVLKSSSEMKKKISLNEKNLQESASSLLSKSRATAPRAHPNLKSKFTCAADYPLSDIRGKNSENNSSLENIFEKISTNCESCFPSNKLQSQTTCHCICRGIESKPKSMRLLKQSSFKDSSIYKYTSESDVFTSALAARKQIIDAAKRREEY